MKEVEYYDRLTEKDKVRVTFRKHRGHIEHFVIQYYALVEGKWRTIMRIDTCHGFTHKHSFHSNGKQYIIKLPENIDAVFTNFKKHVTQNFAMIKDNYWTAK